MGEHNQSVYEALRWVLKRRGESANDLKAETLPELYRSLVRADDKVELHRPKARVLGQFFGVETHRSGDTTASSMSRRHVSAVAYVCTATTLICTKVVGAEDVPVFLSDENLVASREPV